ncbi:adenosylcobinamide-phosphate synthase CbiB [Gloeocapsa sp. PCC 73106]|uniref:adenosylcobinamide-phosphate synthase CbiB n=1 Tax=Gloeocapsa sp. PCC 73106 TaxID=102232 RepID=UPI0002AC287A|nr:adenosylcobinamide-phosphate synthase CbiB [Gloeocapsa sp. PCC 73106]ELR96601.1 cobalamin biosynthesis protein CobD [Gloeocapsa sp. PCC 73106]
MFDIPTPALVLVLASILDYLIGDPPQLLHPVQVMGWLISTFSHWVISQQKKFKRFWGIILSIALVVGCACLSWLLIKYVTLINPWLGIATETILLASCFAARSLKLAALEVIQPLKEGNLTLARSHLSKYVGRDTATLSEKEILRAVLETISENTTDGVTAPLFYAIVGAMIPSIGPVPLAMAYKAASTLDSMIGYRREPYTDLGWFSANLDDRLTWIPCRLTVFTLALISRKPLRVWRICQRDAHLDPSPNSGWSESVYAAILGVQLGGENRYQGVIVHKPFLGDPIYAITPDTVIQALNLTRLCFLTWLTIAVYFAR